MYIGEYVLDDQKWQQVFQNPRDAHGVYFLIPGRIYVHVCVYVSRPSPNEKRTRPEIRYPHSDRPYLKTFFCFLK